MELMKIITKSAFNSNYIEYESKEYKNKNLSITKYLYIIIPYLSDMINHNIIQSEWKIQLSMEINFRSSNDSYEICTMHTKSDNIDILVGNETNDIIE